MVLGLVALLTVAGGVYAYTSKNNEVAMMEQKASEQKMMMEQKAMEEQKKMGENAIMEKKDTMTTDTAMMSKGSYQVYSPEKLALAEQGKVVLFFKASWCPTCRALDADIKKNLGAIPDGVTILEVDYDNSTELKQKYGVTTQHTLVQVDAKGNQLATWRGGNNLDSVIKNIK